MSDEKTDTSDWRLMTFLVVLFLNALIWAVGIALTRPQDIAGAFLFLTWAMAVGVSSTWLAIIHVLLCRVKTRHSWHIVFYLLPTLLLLAAVKITDMPLPGQKKSTAVQSGLSR